MTSRAIDLIGDSSGDSDGSRSPSPPPLVPARPKLRTRRAIAYEEDDEDDDADLRAALLASANANMNTNANVGDGDSKTRRPRQRNALVATTRDSDDSMEVHEEDDDYAHADERTEEEDDDEEEEDDEDNVGRRRSGRARRTVRRSSMRMDDELEDDEGDVEIRVMPRRGGGGGANEGGGGLEHASRRRREGGGGGLEHASRRRRAPPPNSTTSTSRKRKRPASSATSSSKAKAKTRKPRQRHHHIDEEDAKRKSSESSDVDADWLLTDDDETNERTNGKVAGKDDEIDENAFIVEKILAREVHTLKEWTRLRQHKTTRFLTNASIFLDDSDDDGEKEEASSSNPSTAVEDGGDEVVVVLDGPSSSEPPQKEEERFLIKWKNLSYIHVSWETEENLMEVDRNVKAKIQRFREKELLGLISDRLLGDEYFNPEFRDVDRILDIQDTPGDKYTPVDDGDDEDDADGEPKPKLKYMLIKWKAQPYDAITWEREDDVHDDAAVKEYDARLKRSAQRYKRMATTKSTSKSQARKNPKFRGYTSMNLPPFKTGQAFELRDYQLTGVNWMLFNWYQRRNSMLADEMGLGKTVQTVTYVNHLAVVEELAGPYLIVAPLSTLGHWQREFTNWTNLNAVVYHGSAEARKAIQDYEFFLTEAEYRKTTNEVSSSKAKLSKVNGGTCYRFDVLITTYEMCSTPDFAKLARVKWQLLAVDEAHRLKNRNSKLSVLIQKNFNYENILLLTGTPLQNNVEELWTLLNFLDPNRFDSMEDFLADYGELKDVSQVEKLHGELKPFLLRRMKEDVEKSLAPKEETIIEVELTVLQKQYYRAIFEQNTEFLARGMKRSHAPSLMNVLMELRKCCNHPFLIRGMEQREVARLRDQKDTAKEEMERQAVELLVTASGKLILLDKLLPRLKANGHRVLIFSQFKIMLDILQDYLRLRSYRCERIDGNITGNDRQAAIDRFSDPESLSFIMLLSTRAGGVGINLTSADTVIIYDSDWNPQNDLQAQARCHRIGQKKSVKIYRLLTAKTYELHMFHQASLKLGLDQAVLGSIRDREQQGAAVTNTKRPNAPMSKDEIENLLKHGAYEMFKEDKEGEAEAASKRFSEESIDQILSRSTKIIHDPKAIEDGGAGDGKKSLMSSFSKATFVSSDNPDAQVALDDPDFWTKVIGLQAPEKVEPSPLKKRRCRREIKSYAQEDSGEEEMKKRGHGRGRPKKQDADFEEYVISSSSDDEDDDDEDGTEGFADDDFVDGVKKSKKPKQPKLPQLYLYQERVCDLLTTFGYGRWIEMTENNLVLAQYPVEQIQAFCQELIASLVRVAATSFLKAKQTPQPPRDVEGQVLPQAAPLPPVSPTPQQLDEWLNLFASRYRFITGMLADMRVPAISDVLVFSPGLARSASTVKSEREATNRLQLMDRLYLVRIVVQQQIGPIAPMVALIKDFHRLKDPSKIASMIRDGVLPPHRSDKLKSAVKSPTALEKIKKDGVDEVKTASGAGEKTVAAAKATADDRKASEAQEDGEAKSVDSIEKPEPSVADSSEAPPIATVPESTVARSAVVEPPVAVLTMAQSTTAESTAAENSVQESRIQDDSSASTDHKSVAHKADDTKDADPSSPPVVEPMTVSEDKTDSTVAASVPSSETTPSATTQHQTLSSASPATLPTTPLIKEQHLRVALSRLRLLPDLGVPETVSPWWISRTDDVLLLLFVFKHGWFKGRALPSALLRDSTLFGARALQFDPTRWPTLPVLNKRVRSLLGLWSNGKRLVAHANIVRQREKMRAAAVAATTMAAIAAPPALPPGMQPPPTMVLVPQFGTSASQPSDVNPLSRTSSDDDAVRIELAAKRKRFAKLVHQFGIPDTSACTSDQAQLDKWRHFRNDPLLDIGRYPPIELQREARDLERFCRLRQDDSASAAFPPLPVPPMRSILGSRRGTWTLSPTQCRRLVHRIDLFRVLRLELLVLSQKQLGVIVDKVIDEICATDARMIEFFPEWWGSPRHDVLLLQGVEYFGFDTGVPQVWTLPQLIAANPTSVFPSATWVENHVNNLVMRAHRLIQQTRLQRRLLAHQSLEASTSTQQRQPSQPSQPSAGPESVERQRFRDIHGMRQEDPRFNADVAKRKWQDKAESEKAEKARKGKAGGATEASTGTEKKTTAQAMKREEPDFSQTVKGEGETERNANAEATDKAVPIQNGHMTQNGRPPLHADTEVIELDDDDDEEEEAKAEEPRDKAAETETTTTSSTSSASAEDTTIKPTHETLPAKDAAATADADEDRSSGAEQDEASSKTANVREPATDESSPPSTTSQKRKRTPRSWEVIVIDDSDDDDNDAAPVKRTTRSRRRHRGDGLADGL